MGNKKLRVLHFELDKNLGGIESFLLNLYTQIDRERVQFEFVTTCENPALGDELVNLGGIIHRVANYKDIMCYQRDITKLLSSEYDIIHVHKNSAANIFPIILAKKSNNAKVIVHSHNTSPSTGRITKYMHLMNKGRLNRMADVKYACSNEAGRWMYGNNTYQVMPNGILVDHFRYDENKKRAKRIELGIAQDAIVIGHVGRFTTQKNHALLIDIFKNIVQIQPNCVLLLVGVGELQGDIIKKVKGLGLSDRIIFAGVRQDVAEIMIGMDVFVMPSIYEGLPIVAVEAQATGLPVFLSDRISKDTELSDAITWFSNENDVNEIANSILKKVRDNTDEIRLQRNKQIILKGYDMKNTANQILKCYELLSNQ